MGYNPNHTWASKFPYFPDLHATDRQGEGQMADAHNAASTVPSFVSRDNPGKHMVDVDGNETASSVK
jgi:hypothetical protein